jgi:predicted PhzF superfamily epimerase YddE/YHI9
MTVSFFQVDSFAELPFAGNPAGVCLLEELGEPSAAPDFDMVSRCFVPGAGIAEDPVTGSAHCALAPYWQGKLGRDELVGFQASARGGVVRVRWAGDRVKLAGRAVTVLRGALSMLSS